MLETNTQMSQNVETVTENGMSIRKLLNVAGIFIFGGLAITNLTNPLQSSELAKEFLLFISGSSAIYYLLINVYFIGVVGRKIVISLLILLGCFSVYMAFHLTIYPLAH